jgi:CDP-diacylglycerol pyrophosphatase
LCAAVGFPFAQTATSLEVGRDALWLVVRTCVANHALTGAAFPCLTVNVSNGEQRGYVILRAPSGRPDLILSPTRKTVGVEDPSLQTLGAPNYFEDAWNARSFLSNGSNGPLAHDDVALAVNSRLSRSQDQLHIHIGCVSPDVKQALQALAPELPGDRWVRIGSSLNHVKTLFATGLWGHRVDKETLAGVNPFRLAAEVRSNDTETSSQLTIVVAGVQLAKGRGGFVLLASYDNAAHSFSAETFLDPSCSR